MRNIVVITADDLSYFALGLSGLEYPKVTNFIDSFANKGYWFKHAYSNIAICEASRSVLMTGLYPQNNGSLSFIPAREGIPTLPAVLKKLGYSTCVLGKEGHYRPQSNYRWDEVVGGGFDANAFVNSIGNFLKTHKPPYFIHANSLYPHRPYEDRHSFDISKITKVDFLPNNPYIREDLCRYYASVVKFDNMAQQIVETIQNIINDTLFVITSDHGMSFPYCKGNCYSFGNSIPMIFVGPNIVRKADSANLVTHVDFMSTILEYVGCSDIIPQDGMSYCKLITGVNEIFEREVVYTQFNKFIAPSSEYFCRSIFDLNYCYTFNFTTSYPIWDVDGWGWDQIVKNMTSQQLSEFQNRPKRELFNIKKNRFTRENVINVNELVTTRMHRILLDYMEKYNDTLFTGKKKDIKVI